jgi:hypothetical protein
VLWENVTEVEKGTPWAFRDSPAAVLERVPDPRILITLKIPLANTGAPTCHPGVPCVLGCLKCQRFFPSGRPLPADFIPSCSRLWPIPVSNWSPTDRPSLIVHQPRIGGKCLRSHGNLISPWLETAVNLRTSVSFAVLFGPVELTWPSFLSFAGSYLFS